MSEPRRSRLTAGLVIVLVFLAGVATGYLAQHLMTGRHGRPGFAVGGQSGGRQGGVKRWMLDRLDHDLKLTPAQHARIDSVLTRREADLRTVMTETRPRFDSIAGRTRSDIRAVLTPEQQDEFTKLTREMEARRRHRGLAPPDSAAR
jgi:Spy/CpxP family protein refolding chaperone